MLTFSREWAILTLETGALPANGQSPYSVTEVTACLGAGRLLLFISLNEQATNADDYKAKLQNFGCTHLQPPFLEIRGSEAPLTTQGTNRLPFFGNTAVIINHFLALCKA